MENETQTSIQSPPQVPLSVSSRTSPLKILSLTALGLFAVAGSVIVGIQIGNKQTSNQSVTAIVEDSALTPTITSRPTPFPLSKTDPAKIVEEVRSQMGIGKNTVISPTTFTWNGEVVTGRSESSTDCTDKTTSIAGYGFIAYDIPQFKEPNLASLGYANAQSSTCNEASGTLKGQTGYIVDSVLCILSLESKTIDGPAKVEFSCGYPSTVTTPTPDVTADWKTYVNTRFGFEIKYPSYFKTQASDSETGTSEATSTSRSLYLYDSKDSAMYEKQYLSIQDKLYENMAPSSWTECGELINSNVQIEKYGLVLKTDYGDKNIYRTKHNGKIIYFITSGDQKKQSLINQILSTFKFLEKNTLSPTDTKIKKLSYSVPTGWATSTDTTNTFQFSYDATKLKPCYLDQKGISLCEQYGNFMSSSILPYDNGSRHQFIYNNGLGTPRKDELFSDYREQEYDLDGKTCLFLNGIAISQYHTVWGMCVIDETRAMLFTSGDRAEEAYEEILKTFKLIK